MSGPPPAVGRRAASPQTWLAGDSVRTNSISFATNHARYPATTAASR
jgi:hypothetical protein